MTSQQDRAIRELREAGYAVILWYPEELGNSSASEVEDLVVERGNEIIYELNPDMYEEDEA